MLRDGLAVTENRDIKPFLALPVTESESPAASVEAVAGPTIANPEAGVRLAAKPPFSDFWMKRRRETVLVAITCRFPL